MSGSATGKSATGWVFDPAFLRHNAGIDHPETPARLQAIVEALDKQEFLSAMTPVPFTPVPREILERVHPRAHTERISNARGHFLDPDTFVSEESPEIALLAAGAVVEAARLVWQGTLANAFCAVRPPGHHALSERAMGFCLYNNIAVAAEAIRNDTPGAKVFILDWDVHHGNGTQAIFYENPEVLYASVHRYPFYPGTGSAEETGRGAGKGMTVNFPLSAGAGDKDFLGAIEQILDRHATPFAPNLVLVSAGFDAHRFDPLGGLNVTTQAFADATRLVCEFARASCDGRIVSVLEGGYDLGALADSVTGHVSELMTAARTQPGGRN
jgi:acetoin utilization deacetylase AcuC-like enzyme